MRGSSIERRLEQAEAKAGTSGGFFNPRSAEQSAIADQYWHAVILQGFNKVPAKLRKQYARVPPLQCEADTNKVVYERIAAGILGRVDPIIRKAPSCTPKPEKTELRPLENAQNPPRSIRVRTLT